MTEKTEEKVFDVTAKGDVYELVPSYSELLRTPLEPFDFKNFDRHPTQISLDLMASMKAHGGIGLSANQIGLKYRVFVMHSEPAYTCFNPKIVDFSEETVLLEEGCLSYPLMKVKVRRPRGIRARFTVPNGETLTLRLEGLASRVFQHELDHLDGIPFFTRAALVDRQTAFKNQKIALRRQKKK